MRLHLPLLSLVYGLAFGWACKPTVGQDPAPDLISGQAGRVVQIVSLADSVRFNPANLLSLEEGLSFTLGSPKHGTVQFAGGSFVYTFKREASPLGGSSRLLRDTLGFTLTQGGRSVVGSFVFAPASDSGSCRPLDVSATRTIDQGDTLDLDLATLGAFCPGTIFSLPFDTNGVSLSADGHFVWMAAHAGPHPFNISVRNGDFSATLSLAVSVRARPDTTPVLDCPSLFAPQPDQQSFIWGGTTQIDIRNLIVNDSACVNDIRPESYHVLQGPFNGNVTRQGDPGSPTGPTILYYVPTRRPVADSLQYEISTQSGATRPVWLRLVH